jgi:hypothetical protein
VDDGDGEKKMATKEAKPSFTPSGMRDDSGVDSVETDRDEKDDDEHGAIVRWGYALVPDEIDPENMPLNTARRKERAKMLPIRRNENYPALSTPVSWGPPA